MPKKENMKSLHERPFTWFAISIIGCIIWAVLFYLVAIVLVSYHLLHFPLGLGGAVYPAIFLRPVAWASLAYQSVILLVCLKVKMKKTTKILLTLAFPCLAIATALLAFCPMDTQTSLFGYIMVKQK